MAIEGNEVSSPEVAKIIPFPLRKETIGKQQVDDEFANHTIKFLEPLQRTLTIRKKESNDSDKYDEVDIAPVLQKDFVYLSRTRRLEQATPRVQILQDIADKMTDGLGIQTRVVIMNKGEKPEAFVFPDGTMFISQSLINAVGSLDEVGAVMAHEIRHLTNKTYENSQASYDSHKFGIGWLHEAAADNMTPELLVKAGLNSRAFAEAIKRISGSGRGDIHMSGLTRASLVQAHHLGVDHSTSNQDLTPIPEPLNQKDALKTNLEILEDAIKKGDVAGFAKVINLLHPNDLQKAPHMVAKNEYLEKGNGKDESWRVGKEAKILKEMYVHFDNLVAQRVIDAGFSLDEARLFLICLYWDNDYPNPAYLISSPEDFLDLAKKSIEFDKEDKSHQLHALIFDIKNTDSSETRLLRLLSHEIYDPSIGVRTGGIPMNRDSLMEVLTIFRETEDPDKPCYSSDLGKAVLKYIDSTFLIAVEDQELDEDQIRDFAQEIKEIGVYPYEDAINKYPREFKRVFFGNRGVKISLENQIKVKKILKEVFYPKKEEIFDFSVIDQHFDRMHKRRTEFFSMGDIPEDFEVMLKLFNGVAEANNFDEQHRVELINYINQKIDQLPFNLSKNILKEIDLQPELEDSEYSDALLDPEIAGPLMRFSLKLLVALSGFENDKGDFYPFVTNLMDQSGININNLSRIQMINICQGLFAVSQGGLFPKVHTLYDKGKYVTLYGYVGIGNFDQLFNLPFVKKIVSSEEQLNFDNVGKLTEFALRQRNSILEHPNKWDSDLQDHSLYSDRIFKLVFGKNVRGNFEKILERGLKESEFGEVFDFVDTFYPKGVLKDEILRGINRRYLLSPDVSLDDKTQYLVTHFDRIGPEGMSIVAEQIEDLQTYSIFSAQMGERLESYLAGDAIVTKLAAADLVSSFFTNHFGQLFDTCDNEPANRKRISTRLAEHWWRETMEAYDKQLNKFRPSSLEKTSFRTVADLFTTAKNLSHLQKFGIIHKALTESGGALTSAINRQELARQILKSLKIQPGFIADVIEAACIKGKADIIGAPASNMLAPLLFSAVSLEDVDFDEMEKNQFRIGEDSEGNNIYGSLISQIGRDNVVTLTQASTRDALAPGKLYPVDSYPYKLAQESEQSLLNITDTLLAEVGDKDSQEGPESKRDDEFDPGLESVIKGVEATGALGVRTLQLLTQILPNLTESQQKRLSQCYDSNAGLNKLLFWKNLEKLSNEDPAIREFAMRIKLKQKVGGGSLFTAFAATLLPAAPSAGAPQEIVVKMLRPNAEAFISESEQLAQTALDTVATKKMGGSAENRKFAKIGQMAVDLSSNWCKKDINDATFAEDDHNFRANIKGVNQQLGQEVFYAPEVVFNNTRFKAEGLADGSTFNARLNNPDVAPAMKKDIADNLARFFVYQLKHPTHVNEFGEEALLVHSDPHPGNYLIDKNQRRIGVIDRGMYLRLSRKDIAALEPLITGKADLNFLQGFMDRILDINKVRNPIQRNIDKGLIGYKLLKEHGTDHFKGKTDNALLLRTLLVAIADRNLDVPLPLRLMIKNIASMQELLSRQGLNLADYY